MLSTFKFTFNLSPHILNALDENAMEMTLLEIGILLIFGMVGAILAALFISFMDKLNTFLSKYNYDWFNISPEKGWHLLEAYIHVFVCTTFFFMMLLNFSELCTEEDERKRMTKQGVTKWESCPEGTVPLMQSFIVTFEEGYHEIVNADESQLPNSLLIALFLFIYIFSIFFTRYVQGEGVYYRLCSGLRVYRVSCCTPVTVIVPR